MGHFNGAARVSSNIWKGEKSREAAARADSKVIIKSRMKSSTV